MLDTGTIAPDFRGKDQHGKDVVLSELVKDGPVVLYFYPKDFTMVCTQEACLFRDASEELAVKNARVVGVSPDDVETHGRFAKHHGLSFALVADPDKKIAKSFDAVAMFGLRTARITYVIDGERRIRGAFHHELSARKHLDGVQRVVDSLSVRPRTADPA